jgi:tetratricopeptide (TPR) repeat protein
LDGAAPNLQDVLRLRQQDTFVGRDSRLAEFQDNLRLPALHPDRRYIVNIHGIAGVGKSFLLQQFRRIAQAEGAASALVDEDYFDVVETMSALAAEFGRQDARLTEFEAQLATYRQRRRELESDPNAPLGDLITTTTVRAGLSLAKTVPVAGALTEFVDSDAVAAQANRFRTYLVQRFGKKSDIDLLLSPVEVLTRSFVDSINRVAAERRAVLCFDTFERTAPYLESWLLDLFTGKFGGLSANVVTVIAGQQSLADNRWSPLRSLIAAHPLEPFTEEEARGFLAQRGVTSEAVVDVILPLSGRIPMWLATLAENSPQDPGEIPDPSENAVKRFLKWEPDEERQKLAKAAALPRRFNRDILLAIPEAGGADLFEWLLQLPFVSRAGEYWRYHDAVRDPMLRLARITSPQQWRAQHQALAEHFADEQAAQGISDEHRWHDPDGQTIVIEEAYHRLCSAPGAVLPPTLEGAVVAAYAGVSMARRWSAMLTEAGGAAGAERVRSWGRRLTDLLKDEDDDTAYLTALVDSGELGTEALANALAIRGDSHRLRQRYEASLSDLDRAIELQPGEARYHQWRGLTLQGLERYEEAVAELTRSLELDGSSGQVYGQRAMVLRMMDRGEETLADLDRAIALEPENGWLHLQRGLEHQIAARYEEALADYGRAVELDPEDDVSYRQRGVIHQLAARYEEALSDLDRAIELDPLDGSSFTQRGYTYHLMKRETEAFADLDRAVELEPEDAWVHVFRGVSHADLDRAESALADFDRAIELNPDIPFAFAQRGWLHRTQERYAEAVADLDRALELDQSDSWAYANHGSALRALERYEESLPDFDRALEIQPDYQWVFAQRGASRSALGRHDAALPDLDRALELDPTDGWALTLRGQVFRALGRFEESLADFDRCVELSADLYWDLVERATTYRMMERFEESLSNVDRAIGLEPERAWAYTNRAAALLGMGRFGPAVAAVDRALALEAGDGWTYTVRGRLLRNLGRYEEARAELDRAVELYPRNSEALAHRGDVHRQLGNLDAALADLDRAIELFPDDPWNYSQRSVVRFLTGDSEAAFADLDRLLESDGSTSWWRFLNGVFRTATGREAEGADEVRAAVDLVREEIEAEPDQKVHRFNLVVGLLYLGETEAARTALAEVLRTDPGLKPALDFVEDLAFLAACPGIEVEGLEEFSRTARAYWEARLAAEAE